MIYDFVLFTTKMTFMWKHKDGTWIWSVREAYMLRYKKRSIWIPQVLEFLQRIWPILLSYNFKITSRNLRQTYHKRDTFVIFVSNCLETIYLSATYQHWALVDTDQWMYSNSLWIEEISILHLNVLKPFRLFLLDNENWVRNSSQVSQHLSKSRDDWLKSTNTSIVYPTIYRWVYRTSFWKPTHNRMRVENFASKSESNCPCQLFAWNITQISASASYSVTA